MAIAKRKVLIVEDDFFLYEELVSFFRDKGYDIIQKADGFPLDTYEDALKLLQIEENEPYIAVLDVSIKGDKDGLQLAAFIKKHFRTIVVILTGHKDFEILERSRQISVSQFLLKQEKPVDKEQLWASIYVALPKPDEDTGPVRIRQGNFFDVKEVDTKSLTDGNEIKPDYEPLDIKTLIKWEDITFIKSYNTAYTKKLGTGKKSNNSILIHTTDRHKGYIHRSPISEFYKKLPIFFAQFDQSTIVNISHLDAKVSGNLYFMGKMSFILSETYKKAAIERISLILGQ